MPLQKLGAPPFLGVDDVDEGAIVVVVREPYIVPAEKTKWGKARGRVTVRLPNGEERRWTMNTTTWDACIDGFGAEPELWLDKKIRIRKQQQVVTGEDKVVLYGAPYKEPQQPLAE